MKHKLLITSDTHFAHGNVIRYCDRPFALKSHNVRVRPSEIIGKPVSEVDQDWLRSNIDVDVRSMNQVMTLRWNYVVGPFDTVLHLGDFAMGKAHELPGYLSKLNGRKILVRGNHDRSPKVMLEAGFDEVHDELTMEIDGIKVYMHHQPRAKKFWNGAQIHLCGHVHEKWRRYGDMINVGVDQWNFTPRTFQELIQAESQGRWPKESEME